MQQRRRHRRHIVIAQGMYQGACLIHARAQLASYNQQQNTTFISTHACSRGDNTGDTLQLHKACTKVRASSMPMHSRCHIINNKTQHLSAVTHAAKATTQENTLQLHKACTKGGASSMPVHSWHHVINNKTQHSLLDTHTTKVMAHTARPWPRTTLICNARSATDPQNTYPYPYYAHTIYVPPTYSWSVSTRLVLMRLPLPSPLTTEDHNVDALQLF